MPYIDAKVSCHSCGATFTTRLDETTPFYCDDGGWHNAELPCPLCGSAATTVRHRPQADWIELDKHEHEHTPSEENPEP